MKGLLEKKNINNKRKKSREKSCCEIVNEIFCNEKW